MKISDRAEQYVMDSMKKKMSGEYDCILCSGIGIVEVDGVEIIRTSGNLDLGPDVVGRTYHPAHPKCAEKLK